MTLLELLQLMRKHLKLVILLPIVCALAMGVYSYAFMANTYTASTSMYVLAKQTSTNSDNAANYSNLNASQMLANDVSTLLKSDRIAADTVKNLHLDSLKGYSTKVTSETTSRVITLSVTGTDPDTSAAIANEMASNVSKVAQQVMDVQSVNVIDQAVSPSSPSGPNRSMYIAVALLAGLFVAIAIVVVSDMLNTKVRNADEVEELLGLPVIGRMPAVKGGK
ncbi:Wzz/FepE/Etk N-terminal domain-containing protein [uncultured Senegalimassilia sp.]|uniref:YveK family protein n=1 Tax=uncultured Senegalimassilia sp. TaxID=1714350 RepID=UPI0025D083D4|nr:Wzz/FepE/Etk N-terminal domain-containing protein [uncultured Senegalimassilia sp.]